MNRNDSLGRRKFLRLTTAGVAAALLVSASASLVNATTLPKIKAIAFDAFPIFDPRPVFALAEEFFPGRATELCNEWRTRQFEYTWLRTMSGSYVDFWQVTKDALRYAAKKLRIEISRGQVSHLMDEYLNLKSWPDVAPALRLLKTEGIRMVVLSNFTSRMLNSCVMCSGLFDIFEGLLSTDQVKAFKPDPRAYGMGVKAFDLAREEILFVAHGGWDAAGAKMFGYPTYWVNRLNLPPEELGVMPDGTAADLKGLANFIQSRNS
jgi:2-haloacid dehalogenase